MTKYLLTYFQGNRFMSEIVNAYDIADIIGSSARTNRRNFKVYLITPEGPVPMQISGEITSMVVTISDGNYIDTARYIRRS